MLDAEKSADEVVADLERPMPEFRSTDVLAASYSLSRTENRMLYRWLFREIASDIRFLLHDRLKSSQFKKRYDIVIIDAPPRITTASVNALAASSHVLVPTILDSLSVSAASNTLELMFKLRDRLAPALDVLGVVPTMVHQATSYLPRELRALADLRTEAANFQSKQPGRIEIFEKERIVDRSAIAAVAHQDVAYFSVKDAQAMFKTLGVAISERIGGNLAERVRHATIESKEAPRNSETSVVRLGR
jgi:cellulose biosynthesis protein BcsQ